MVSFAPLRRETAEDQRLYLEGRLVEVGCLDCLARVRVRKNSEHHTSIQWTSEAVRDCAEFARRDAAPGGRAVYESCSRLKASIEDAVRAGRLQTGEQDG
ncbi:MAG: hypothetical protein ACRDPJ_10760 [Nocardioidaceae bacterium]